MTQTHERVVPGNLIINATAHWKTTGLGLPFPSEPRAFMDPVLLLPTILLASCLYTIIYNNFFHPLKGVPGPWLARVSQSWRNVRYLSGVWHRDAVDVYHKYGNVVRIAPNEILFVDVAGLKALYGHGKQIQKTKWYGTWHDPSMPLTFFAVTDIKLHRHLRSRVAATYSMTSILSMEPLVQEIMDLNLRKLGELADEGEETIQMEKWVEYFTFDTVGQLGLGGPLGCLETGSDKQGIITSIHDGIWLMANMGNVPFQTFWFNNRVSKWLIRNFGGVKMTSFDVFLEWLDKRVSSRMANGLAEGERRDMLQNFIEAKDQSGNPVTKADVMIEAVNLLAAGADTTSIGIVACLASVLSHPEHKKRLMDEIDQAYDSLGLSGSANHREISFKEAEKIPFLSAIIWESIRLHPSIQYQLPRYAPPGGVQIGAHYVPEGTVCSINPVTMNRSREIFGEDADEFRPQRWIATSDEDQERTRAQHSLLTTFGMGSRTCSGKHLAMVEMYKYIAQFFRHFDAEIVNKDRPFIVRSQWTTFQEEFMVKIQRRVRVAVCY